MKTIHPKELFEAYYEARRNKRNNKDVLLFEMHYERYIFDLYEELLSGTYSISPSTAFIVHHPVKREIFAGDFRDRIVHHWIFNRLSPLCERVFLHDTYSCRIGKGTSFGVKRMEHFIRSVSRNYSQDAFVLKLDIRGYFMAINRCVLFEKIKTLLERYKNTIDFDKDFLLGVMKKVVFNDPTTNCRIRGKREDWIGLPKSKSLFFTKPHCGLPIGNLTSQLFANLYLNDFDHFVQKKFPGVRYGRYVDDVIFVSRDKEVFKEILKMIGLYLTDSLGLSLHPKKTYLQHYTKGFHFLGKWILPYRVYLKNSTKQSVRIRLREKRENDEDGKYLALAQTWKSYKGLFDSCNTHNLLNKMFVKECDVVCSLKKKVSRTDV